MKQEIYIEVCNRKDKVIEAFTTDIPESLMLISTTESIVSNDTIASIMCEVIEEVKNTIKGAKVVSITFVGEDNFFICSLTASKINRKKCKIEVSDWQGQGIKLKFREE